MNKTLICAVQQGKQMPHYKKYKNVTTAGLWWTLYCNTQYPNFFLFVVGIFLQTSCLKKIQITFEIISNIWHFTVTELTAFYFIFHSYVT